VGQGQNGEETRVLARENVGYGGKSVVDQRVLEFHSFIHVIFL
jgi:hypothetical protein